MRFFTLVYILFFLNTLSYAQYNIKQNNVWAFGYHAGLDFNSGNPVPIQTGIEGLYMSPGSYFIEGSASVCDSIGALLFYGSADSIYDKNGHRWPHGFNLMPHLNSVGHDTSYEGASTGQGLLIVPVIGNKYQYYLFCIEDASDLSDWGDMHSSRLYYSVADMTLNGGLGDIVATKKGIKIDSILSEKMIAIAGNNCDVWVLVHSMDTMLFKAYHITSSGIDLTPVVSRAGYFDTIGAYSTGVMKVSPDRTKIVLCNHISTAGIELCSFDPSTGAVSNAMLIDSTEKAYGACFSPDNSKLYIELWAPSYYTMICQYNANLTSASAIAGSRVVLDSEDVSNITDMRLAPDGKIYCNSFTNKDSMDCIKFPNLTGSNCQLTRNAIQLLSGTSAEHSLTGTEYVKPMNCPLSVAETSEAEQVVSINPNPNTGSFILKGNTSDNKNTVEIINSTGQLVYREEFFSATKLLGKQVSLSNSLAPGIYVLRLTNKAECKTIPFVIAF